MSEKRIATFLIWLDSHYQTGEVIGVQIPEANGNVVFSFVKHLEEKELENLGGEELMSTLEIKATETWNWVTLEYSFENNCDGNDGWIGEWEYELVESKPTGKESELDENANKCRDCGVVEGEFHVPGCDAERCPFCGGQLVSCNCMNKHFDIDYGADPSSDQFIKWEELLKEKGLIPYGKENN